MPSGKATTVIDYAPDEAEQNDTTPFLVSWADAFMHYSKNAKTKQTLTYNPNYSHRMDIQINLP